MMAAIRRRLASCALALTVLQFALLFAAPVSACCRSAANQEQMADDVDCCVPGSHPPGQCPLKSSRASRTAQRSAAECSMSRDAGVLADLVLGAIGVLPDPQVLTRPHAPATRFVEARLRPSTRTSLPDAPPPRFL